MATTPSIKVIKSFPFKGTERRWSNRYHFSGGVPANSTQWDALMDAVTTVEAACHKMTTVIVEAVGYEAGSDVPVHTKNYATAGSNEAVGAYAPGEVAALCRWSTSSRTTKNHPKYLFNYFHGVVVHTAGEENDLLAETQQAAFQSFANAWIAGFSDGTHTLVRAGPQGDIATAAFVENYVTHRDFPYTRSA